MRTTAWEDTVERARDLADRAKTLDVAWLAAAVRQLAAVAPRWEDLTGGAPAERSYRPIHRGEALEAWLICWPRGGRLQLHDHGGAPGAFQVVDGILDEVSLQGRTLPDGGLTALGAVRRQRRVGPGRPIAFDGHYIHDVRNTADAPATSVHVYGPARRPMAFYRLGGDLVRTVGRRPAVGAGVPG